MLGLYKEAARLGEGNNREKYADRIVHLSFVGHLARFVMYLA